MGNSQSYQSQGGSSVIKSLTEAAFLSSSSVVVKATTAILEPVTTATVSPEISSSSTSEASTAVTAEPSVTAIIELLLLQLWKLCGYSQLPTATVLPVVLLWDQEEKQSDHFMFSFRFFIFNNSILTQQVLAFPLFSHLKLLDFVNGDIKTNSLLETQ